MQNEFLNELRITPETINTFESIAFKGEVCLVATVGDLITAVEFLETQTAVGFDTESRPAFLKGQKFPVAIIQIATLTKTFIFQLKKVGFHSKLQELLSNPNIEKIGVGVRDDIKRLAELADFKPASFTDLSEIAKKKGLIQTGLRALTARYLKRKLVKSSQKTNWARTDLSERQIRYAATDAWVCLLLTDCLEADNTDYFAQIQALAESAQISDHE